MSPNGSAANKSGISTRSYGSRVPELVAILLATRNGAAFLDEQLDSIARQTHPRIDIWASDDGSRDSTVTILKDWQARWKKGAFHILKGPENGFAENFRALLRIDLADVDCIAFCDQDDMWEPRKIEVALAWMRDGCCSTPQLFCSRTLNVSETGETMGMSPLFRKPPSFRNALVQSLAGGNTMVLNRAAWQRLKQASERTSFVSHDWWAYQVVAGVGGRIGYSSEPLVRYRQHGGNLVGANTSWVATLKRFQLLMGGRFSRWNDINLDGLQRNRDMLSDDARAALDAFQSARKGVCLSRFSHLAESGVYRQTARGTLALWLAVAIGRM